MIVIGGSIRRIGSGLAISCAIAFAAVASARAQNAQPSSASVLSAAFANRYEVDAFSRIELVMCNGSGEERRRKVQYITKMIEQRLHSIARLTAPEYLRGMTILTISAANQRALDRAHPDSMAVLPPGERALAALFQSITTRTAGFNTVPLHEQATSTGTHFLMCLLMVVGGSPASTAGGMKTITLAVLILGVVSTLRRRNRIEAFSRTIALPLVRRAAAVVILMGLVVAGFTLILCHTESGSLRQVLFEVVSACGTVGLTTGLTPRLTDIGQALIIGAMFIGRLGPLTLLIALAGQERGARYEYPEETVIIG